MTTAISEPVTQLSFSEAELKVLREKYAKLTQTEFDAFLSAARRYQLNPLANQIYARLQEATQKNPRSVTYMAQIDGFRLIADRTEQYAGNDDPVFDIEKATNPGKATVIVYKLIDGQRVPFSASARWKEYCPGGNAAFMWNRMPYLMLGKCAEALALRKAFPAELSGLYTIEEMHQAEAGDDTPPQQEQSGGQQSKAATSNFTPPPGWPDTTAPELVKWVTALPTIAGVKTALGIFIAEPALTQNLAEWEPVLTSLANRYKDLTQNFTKYRDTELEQSVKKQLEYLATAKQGMEAFSPPAKQQDPEPAAT